MTKAVINMTNHRMTNMTNLRMPNMTRAINTIKSITTNTTNMTVRYE